MPDPLAQDDVLSFDPSSPFLTAPNAGGPPPVAAPSNLQPRIDEAGRRSQAAIDAAERSMDLEERNAAARERELAPIRERQMEMERQPISAASENEGITPRLHSGKISTTTKIGCSRLDFSALSLALSPRNHATNALAAFSGALQGYQEGSKQKFDENMQIWNAENKRAQEASQNALAEYRAILENRKLSMEQMSVELQLAAAKHDDRAMQTAAKTKNELVIAQLYDKHEQALTQVQETHNRLSQSYELAQQRQQQQMAIAQMRALGVTPGQENALIDAIGQYRQAPISGPRGAAIMNLVQTQYPDYDIKKWFDQKARSTIPASVERAGQTAAARTFNTAGANTEIVLSRAGPVLTNAAEAANAVPASQFPRINELYQKAESEIGDPAIRNFKVANEELAGLFASVMNPRSAVITVSAYDHARNLISAADSPEAYQAVLQNIKRLAEREAVNIRRLREGGESLPIEIPPISPNRRASGGQLLGNTAERAGEAAGSLGLPKTSKYGVGSMVPKPPQPPQSGANMPMMLPEGWSVKELQ